MKILMMKANTKSEGIVDEWSPKAVRVVMKTISQQNRNCHNLKAVFGISLQYSSSSDFHNFESRGLFDMLGSNLKEFCPARIALPNFRGN